MGYNAKQGLKGAGQGAAIGTKILPGWGTLIGGALGGLTGLFKGGPSPEELAAIEQEKILKSIEVASPEERMVILEQLKNMGQLTPDMQNAIAQSDTELNSITLDPVYKQAQMEALSRLQQQGTEGLTLSDQAAFNDINKQVAQEEQGRQGAILQNMAARGMGGGGAELAARLQSSQSSADRANTQGTNMAAEASKRALEAVLSGGQLAGTQQQAEFDRQSEIKQSQNLINAFNTANRQHVEAGNVGARNAAKEYNLDYAKDLEQNRVATTNKQRTSNRDAVLDAMDARNAKQRDIANAKAGLGAAQSTSQRRNAEGLTEGLSGLGNIAAAADNIGAFDSLLSPEEKARRMKTRV